MDFFKLYDAIPDVNLYMERLGMELPKEADKAYLDELVFTHQKLIPWGNLDVCMGKKEISIAIPDVFQKMIVEKREGYCMEQNSLFCALLKDMGYDVYACMAKVLSGPPPYIIGHRGTIVKMNGKSYYCDVGFGGPMPAGAIEMVDQVKQEFHGMTFFFEETENDWWVLNRISSQSEVVPVVSICNHPADYCDFIPINHYTCCHTQKMFNYFTDNLLMNIRLEDGYASLTNCFFKIIRGTSEEMRICQTEEEMISILKEIFLVTDETLELYKGQFAVFLTEKVSV